jgi:rootletin
VSRERGDVSESNQLSSLAQKKEALNEELMRLRQRLKQANDTNVHLNCDLEDLVKEEQQVLLEANEKELQQLQEQLASYTVGRRLWKEFCFDTQTNLEAVICLQDPSISRP